MNSFPFFCFSPLLTPLPPPPPPPPPLPIPPSPPLPPLCTLSPLRFSAVAAQKDAIRKYCTSLSRISLKAFHFECLSGKFLLQLFDLFLPKEICWFLFFLPKKQKLLQLTSSLANPSLGCQFPPLRPRPPDEMWASVSEKRGRKEWGKRDTLSHFC